MRRTHPVALASVLDAIVDSQKMRGRMDERRAVQLWPKVVGERMAAVAVAIDAAGGRLKLRCYNPVLRQEIMLSREALIQNLNAMAGTEVIKDITFV